MKPFKPRKYRIQIGVNKPFKTALVHRCCGKTPHVLHHARRVQGRLHLTFSGIRCLVCGNDYSTVEEWNNGAYNRNLCKRLKKDGLHKKLQNGIEVQVYAHHCITLLIKTQTGTGYFNTYDTRLINEIIRELKKCVTWIRYKR
jgi:hypothetical protein